MENNKKRIALYTTIIAAIVCFIGLAIFLYFYKFNGKLSNDQNDWGNFGSYLSGAIGSFLSLSATIALIITIYIQKELLDDSKKLSNATIEAYKEAQSKGLERSLLEFLHKKDDDFTFMLNQKCKHAPDGFPPNYYYKDYLNFNMTIEHEIPAKEEPGSEFFHDIVNMIIYIHTAIEALKPYNEVFYEYYHKRYASLIGHINNKGYIGRANNA